jgi:hypothetical protein
MQPLSEGVAHRVVHKCACGDAVRAGASLFAYCRHRNRLIARTDSRVTRELRISGDEWIGIVRHVHEAAVRRPLIDRPKSPPPPAPVAVDAHHPVLTGAALLLMAWPEDFKRVSSGSGRPRLSHIERCIRSRKGLYWRLVGRPAALAKAAAAKNATALPDGKVGDRERRRRNVTWRTPMSIFSRLGLSETAFGA